MHFWVMGTTAHIVINGGPPDLEDWARQRLEELERRWSRFLPESEVSRLNRRPERLCIVSEETYGVVERAVDAWSMTGGRFDPTVLGCLVNAGYDRSFSELASDGPPVEPAAPAPGCGEIRLWPLIPGVALPTGVQLDLGGIGKGYAADMLAAELLRAGAQGVCINVGGDLRVAGEPPDGAWVVAVDDPFQPGQELLHLTLRSGAVATTTRLKRRWRRGGRDVHHVIDPTSGEPASSGVAAVSVVAGEAWRAEVLAKAAFLAGPAAGARFLADNGVTGLVVDDHGHRWTSPGLEAYAA